MEDSLLFLWIPWREPKLVPVAMGIINQGNEGLIHLQSQGSDFFEHKEVRGLSGDQVVVPLSFSFAYNPPQACNRVTQRIMAQQELEARTDQLE